jgi:hypothetical protein
LHGDVVVVGAIVVGTDVLGGAVVDVVATALSTVTIGVDAGTQSKTTLIAPRGAKVKVQAKLNEFSLSTTGTDASKGCTVRFGRFALRTRG